MYITDTTFILKIKIFVQILPLWIGGLDNRKGHWQ